MKDLIYKIDQAPCKAIYKLLRETVYGTKGVKINHRDTDKKLDQLIQPDFHTLWNGEELMAVAVYCKRTINLELENIDAYYIRYFSVDINHQDKGLGKQLTERVEEHYKNNISGKVVFYAYIEEKNLKSIGVSNHFEPKIIGTMKTLFFSRFSPDKNKNCQIAQLEDIEKVKGLLQERYKDYTTVNLNRIGYEDSYYIYKENNKIIAGVQLVNTKWRIHSLPGFMGWLSLYIFPYIPFLNKVADGKNLKFSGVEGLYCLKGKEDELLILLEHAIASVSNYKAFIYLDVKDSLYKALEGRKDLGFMGKVQKSPSVRIIYQSFNLNEKDKAQLLSSSKYISAFDVT